MTLSSRPIDAAQPAHDDIKALKTALRTEVLARRAALRPEAREAAGNRLADAVAALAIPAGAVVSGFIAIRDEIDPLPALRILAARGHALVLPVVLADRTTMIFRRWAPGEPLVTTGYGLSVPPATAPAVEPSVMLVPLAAFDRRGFRIGYGKGHYDRAIARITAAGPLLEIGVAFACQEIGRVPEEPHDRPMRIVVTETDTIRCDAEAAR